MKPGLFSVIRGSGSARSALPVEWQIIISDYRMTEVLCVIIEICEFTESMINTLVHFLLDCF